MAKETVWLSPAQRERFGALRVEFAEEAKRAGYNCTLFSLYEKRATIVVEKITPVGLAILISRVIGCG